MRVLQSILPAGALSFCLSCGIVGAAETDAPPDKSIYDLFNPVPQQFMRELAPDRPDATETPHTVDAGHFQLEMDFANFTYNTTSRQTVHDWNFAPFNIKAGLLNNLDLQLEYDSYFQNHTHDHLT